jgi:hypothetical protein
MWRALRWLEGSYRAASVVNMWLFLFDGRYRWVNEVVNVRPFLIPACWTRVMLWMVVAHQLQRRLCPSACRQAMHDASTFDEGCAPAEEPKMYVQFGTGGPTFKQSCGV